MLGAGRQPPTLTPIHKRARTWRRESRRTVHSRGHTQKHRHPHRTAKQQCEQHTHGRNKMNEAHPIPPQSFTYPCPEGIALRLTAGLGGWRPILTNEARRTPSAPLRLHSSGRPVTLVPSQWGTQTIVVADYRCL
ncbi:hypothetical protein TcCL_ESM10644 [Trypanosoma cruzi]|nr:hypothetical protein TcCL_ESM10644 [Trypanosoma cruzi]